MNASSDTGAAIPRPLLMFGGARVDEYAGALVAAGSDP